MAKEVILKDKYDNEIYSRTYTSAIYDENTGERLDNTIDTLKKSVSDGKTLVAGAITGKGVNTATDASFETMAKNIESLTDTRDATATAANILKSKTAYVNGKKITGTMPNLTANSTITHASSNGTKVIIGDAGFLSTNSDGTDRYQIRYNGSNGYLQGNTLFALPYSTVATNIGLTAAKIATGNTILGVTGTYKGLGNATAAQVLSGKTFSTASLSNATGTMTDNSAKTSTSSYVTGTFKSGTTGYVFATPTAGYCSASTYIRVPVANLAAGNIKKGVSIGGVAGTYNPVFDVTVYLYKCTGGTITDMTNKAISGTLDSTSTYYTFKIKGPFFFIEGRHAQGNGVPIDFRSCNRIHTDSQGSYPSYTYFYDTYYATSNIVYLGFSFPTS